MAVRCDISFLEQARLALADLASQHSRVIAFHFLRACIVSMLVVNGSLWAWVLFFR